MEGSSEQLFMQVYINNHHLNLANGENAYRGDSARILNICCTKEEWNYIQLLGWKRKEVLIYLPSWHDSYFKIDKREILIIFSIVQMN